MRTYVKHERPASYGLKVMDKVQVFIHRPTGGGMDRVI